MVSMIDRYLIRYFLAVVDQGAFSRAAVQCNVAQPTLSVGIAKLERDLGVRLFVRSNQRVQLTEDGSRFLIHARRIENEFHQAQSAMSGVRERPTLRLGVLRSIPTALVAAAVAATPRGEDQPRLELVEGSERELNGFVARGRLSVALTLVGRGGDRFAEEPLLEEDYRLALSADHPLAERKSVAGEELASEVMIVRRHCEVLSETSRYFTERGVRPHFSLRSTNDDRVLAMVAAGLGLTVMPASHVAAGVRRPRLAGFDPRRTVGLIYGLDQEAAWRETALLINLRQALREAAAVD